MNASTEIPFNSSRKLIVDNSVDTDTIGIEDQGNIDHEYGTWLETLLQSGENLLDTEIDTETLCTPKPAETEQPKQRKIGHGHRVPAWHKASTVHLNFPFQNGMGFTLLLQ